MDFWKLRLNLSLTLYTNGFLEASSDTRKCCRMENLFNRMNLRYIRNGENRRFYVVVKIESERATAEIILIVYAYVSPSILCTIPKEKKNGKT